MSNANRAFSSIACIAVIAISGYFFWPKSDVLTVGELRIASPNGKFYVVITATDRGAKINLGGEESGDIFLSSGPGAGVSVSLLGKSGVGSAREDRSHLIMLTSSDFRDEITLGGIGSDTSILRLASKDDNQSEKPTASIQFLDPNGDVQKEMTGL